MFQQMLIRELANSLQRTLSCGEIVNEYFIAHLPLDEMPDKLQNCLQ